MAAAAATRDRREIIDLWGAESAGLDCLGQLELQLPFSLAEPGLVTWKSRRAQVADQLTAGVQAIEQGGHERLVFQVGKRRHELCAGDRRLTGMRLMQPGQGTQNPILERGDRFVEHADGDAAVPPEARSDHPKLESDARDDSTSAVRRPVSAQSRRSDQVPGPRNARAPRKRSSGSFERRRSSRAIAL